MMRQENIKEYILYDGACPMCSQLVHRAKKVLTPKGFEFVPLQSEWAKERTKHLENPLKEMLVLTREGKLIGGADAAVYLARRFWWGQPLYWVWLFPGMKFIYKKVYSLIAKNRYCISDTCRIPMRTNV